MVRLKDIASINISGNSATSSKLGTSTVGNSIQPIYLNNGVATACTMSSSSGGSWGKLPSVGGDGVMEVGKYIDFKNTNTSTSDYDLRLQIDSDTQNVITLPSVTGTLALTSNIPTNTNQLTNGAGFITGITKAMVTTALGYTPPTSDTNTWRPLGTTSDTACAGNDSRLSNARPASDVYSWAKASSKPSYSWSEITSKPSTFTPSSHSHDYLPLSGGTMTGDIVIPIGRSASDCSVPVSSSTLSEITLDKLSNYKTLIGSVYATDLSWQNVISVRHRNGSSDGNKYGMYIRSNLTSLGNLIWRQHYNGIWSNEKTILDNTNCTSYNSNYSNYTGYVARDRGVNSVSTLASLPVDKSTVVATLSAATSISLSANMNIGESITIFCNPTSSFTQPIPTSGAFISMDGSSFSVTSGKRFEINIYCYNTNVYSISCKTAS